MKDTHDKFYEMTTDRYWATGQRLTADATEIDPSQFTGKNRMGEILTSLKRELAGPVHTDSLMYKLYNK